MYADVITKSMQKTIDETNYRREKQTAYNLKNGVTPTALNKSLDSALAKKFCLYSRQRTRIKKSGRGSKPLLDQTSDSKEN